MRLTSLARGLLVAGIVAGSAYAAGRPPKDFIPPDQMTPDQLAAAKAASKGGNMNDYGKDVPQETEPFPWMLVGLVGLSFVAVAPFAIRSYRNTSKEIAAHAAAAGRQPRDDD